MTEERSMKGHKKDEEKAEVRERMGGRSCWIIVGCGGGGYDCVVTSHTVWLSYAHSRGHGGRTPSPHIHTGNVTAYRAFGITDTKLKTDRQREGEEEEGEKEGAERVAESGVSKRFKSQERSGVSVRFLIHLLNVRGLVSSSFKQWKNVFVTEIMIPKTLPSVCSYAEKWFNASGFIKLG